MSGCRGSLLPGQNSVVRRGVSRHLIRSDLAEVNHVDAVVRTPMITKLFYDQSPITGTAWCSCLGGLSGGKVNPSTAPGHTRPVDTG